MGHDDSKSYQLRVRITAEERSLLDALRLKRDRGETLSDLVREAIALLVNPHANTGENVQRPQIRAHVERLAE